MNYLNEFIYYFILFILQLFSLFCMLFIPMFFKKIYKNLITSPSYSAEVSMADVAIGGLSF